MPTNIEIKARVRALDLIRRGIEVLCDTVCEVICQEDVYFPVATGRLKLRILAPGRAQLIAYSRNDQKDPKLSIFHITETDDPEGLRDCLAAACGIRGVVKKTRHLYRVGQTRIHLDEVEKLGTFLELEVVLQRGQNEMEGRHLAEELMAKIGIKKGDLCACSYIDLVESLQFSEYLLALKELGLPDRLGSYMVFGSGPLGIRGLKKSNDLDVVVSAEVWEYLLTLGHQPVHAASGSPKIELCAGALEIFRDWNDGTGIDIQAMLARAEMIDGVWYADLHDVLAWKRLRNKPKDAADIRAIEIFLKL